MNACRAWVSATLAFTVIAVAIPTRGDSLSPLANPDPAARYRPTEADTNLDMRSPLETWALRPRTVHERFVRDLGNGCEYVSQMNGTMRPREPKHGQTRYRTDVTIASHLECSGRVQSSRPPFRLHVAEISEKDLRQALAEHGRIVATSGPGQVCSYTPSFVIEDARIATRAVWQTCSTHAPTIGGGPATPK